MANRGNRPTDQHQHKVSERWRLPEIPHQTTHHARTKQAGQKISGDDMISH